MSDRARETVRSPLRIGMVSLGCAKNLVDTEVMLGHLDGVGCELVDDAEQADVLIVNTCAFIGPAREESIEAILAAAEHKKTGRARRVVVAGCMVQRYREELADSLPEVDAFVGLDELHTIVERCGLEIEDGTPSSGDTPAGEAASADPVPSRYLYDHAAPRRLSTPPWTAFVKIAEGCDHTCSFCAIPAFRGTFRSRAPSDVVEEARRLADAGVVEVNLIAQDSSHYGRDRGTYDGLARLLERLDGVDGLRWVRVHYLYPNTITDELVSTMARLPRVVDYVDLPLQHAHPATLKRMRRGGSAESHLELLGKFRAAMPTVAMRTTLIVGFPGETDQEFDALERFVEDAAFDHLGVFTYSHEEHTTAIELDDDVPEPVKHARRERIMESQQRIVLDRHRERIGTTVDVLVEGPHPETEHLLVGRAPWQAPDVDGQIWINDGFARPGSLVRVELTEVAGYDLLGKIVGRV